MEPAPEALPDDIAALRALIVFERTERLRVDGEAARLQTEAARLQHEVARLTALTERLDHIIAQLRRLQFGKRSEALDPDQLELGLEDLESAAAEVEAELAEMGHEPRFVDGVLFAAVPRGIEGFDILRAGTTGWETVHTHRFADVVVPDLFG